MRRCGGSAGPARAAAAVAVSRASRMRSARRARNSKPWSSAAADQPDVPESCSAKSPAPRARLRCLEARPVEWASSSVNSALVVGSGMVRLYGPAARRCPARPEHEAEIVAELISGMCWSPSPSFAPSPSDQASLISGNAPPLESSTGLVRRTAPPVRRPSRRRLGRALPVLDGDLGEQVVRGRSASSVQRLRGRVGGVAADARWPGSAPGADPVGSAVRPAPRPASASG